METTILSRVRGAMYGQIIGDNLGALVEFSSPEEISVWYPGGVRELTGGGPFDIAPGQPTDDSELALALARSMVRCGGYDQDDVRESYRRWAASDPFDIGFTCSAALTPPFTLDASKKSNGALMRVSPVAMTYYRDPAQAAELARTDAALTHPNDYTVAVNGLYTEALARVIGGVAPRESLLEAAGALSGEVEEFFTAPPVDVASRQIGFVRHALHLTCYYAVHGTDFEEDLVAIVGMGGDTDTNAAIAGAFLGAVYGEGGIPQRWRAVIDGYSTDDGGRPEEYSAEGALDLADQLASLGE